MSTETLPSTRSLARLMLRHQLAVRFDLLPIEAVAALEVAIATNLQALDILPARPVLRCGLGVSVVGALIDSGAVLGDDRDLVAAQVLMLGLALDDPLSHVSSADEFDIYQTCQQWQQAFGWGAVVPLPELMRAALERFLPREMVLRWDGLTRRGGVEPASIARFLLLGLEHSSPDLPEGPAFEWVDLAGLVPRPDGTGENQFTQTDPRPTSDA
jgi:hypothetical protein